MLNVKQFLELPAFNELKLVAGKGGLDNLITGVNIMDNPDALDWFSGGEMLITSGFFFKDDKLIQNNVIKQLSLINCPVLCIKSRRYLGSIPQNIIALADELNLPVIEIPYGLSFSKIMSIVMEQLSGKYDILNKKSLEIHSKFFAISLAGGGLSKISDTLAEMLQNPVILLDRNWNLLNYGDIAHNPYPLKDIISSNGKIDFLSEDFFRYLPPEFENLQKPIVRQVSISQANVKCAIMPVYISNAHYGFILVLLTIKDLTDLDYIALENGMMALALERIRSAELERTRNRIRRDFLDELLAGKIQSPENLKNLCDLHGINPNLYYTAMVFNVSFHINNNGEMIEQKRNKDEKMKKTLLCIEAYALQHGEILISFSRNYQIIILVGKRPNQHTAQRDQLISLGYDIVQFITNQVKDVTFKCGIGRTSHSLLELSQSFFEANEALRLNENSKSNKFVSHFEDYLIHHFLMHNISPHEMKIFLNQILGSLLNYDKKHDSTLVPTLENWLNNHFNISQAARSLFIHRNTLLYRIEKIKEILKSDLKDPEDLLKIQLALKINHLLNSNNLSS